LAHAAADGPKPVRAVATFLTRGLLKIRVIRGVLVATNRKLEIPRLQTAQSEVSLSGASRMTLRAQNGLLFDSDGGSQCNACSRLDFGRDAFARRGRILHA